VKTNVSPGEPVTAQAWNDIVDALFDTQAVLKTVGGTVTVHITNPNLDLSKARVTASRSGSPPAEAIRPIPPDNLFTFPALQAGAYEIRAEMPGFAVATGSVTVNSDGTVTPQPLEIALTANAQIMPNVLGLLYPAAAAQLQTIHPRVLDASGKDLPLTGFSSDYNNAPVLTQYPLPGQVAPTTGSLVIVATVIKPTPLVPTPNLLGLTVAQAQAALASVGLSIKVI
jgi:hypothetical protein